MESMFIYVEASDSTYEISCSGHAAERISQRFDDDRLDSNFLIRRLCFLIEENFEFADAIVNCVKFGENFILEDLQQGLSIVVSHTINNLGIKTILPRIHNYYYHENKVIRLLKDGTFFTYTYNEKFPNKMEVAWA